MCPTASEGRGYRMAASEFEGTVIPDTLVLAREKNELDFSVFYFVLFRVILSIFLCFILLMIIIVVVFLLQLEFVNSSWSISSIGRENNSCSWLSAQFWLLY
jgi:hypothetical protein